MHAVHRARAVVLGKALRGFLDFGNRIGVEQFAQIGFAQNFA